MQYNLWAKVADSISFKMLELRMQNPNRGCMYIGENFSKTAWE